MIPDVETARRIAEAHCAAWTSRSPDAVAERYTATTSFSINRADPMTTRQAVAEMAAGFMSDFPDLVLTCNSVLVADGHMVYAWTFKGHYRENGNLARFTGWEEWDLDDELKVIKSLGWYDANDYERQIAG
jgi:nuclear transport factor 2 (NTF2) superfamily protein